MFIHTKKIKINKFIKYVFIYFFFQFSVKNNLKLETILPKSYKLVSPI
jgi:hypothetical protein